MAAELPPEDQVPPERPAHPKGKALLLLLGAVIVVVLLAAVSTFGFGD